jgi:hypothetical protein
MRWCLPVFLHLCAGVSIGALAVSVASAAHAEASARDMLAGARKGDTAMIGAIGGIGLGLGWANAELITRKQQPLYCVPPDLGLTAFQTVNVLEAFLKREPVFADVPAGAAVLHAMMAAYPCGR